MVHKGIVAVAKIIIALGISLIVWGLVVGYDGLDGKSYVKEKLWEGINNGYATVLLRETDSLGYGYTERFTSVWDTVNSGVEYTDSRCTVSV